jgi:heterodisulfide reductase subunit D
VARDLAERNQQIIGDSGAKAVITSCPGCLNTMKNDYRRMGLELKADVRHTTELLADLVESGELKFREYKKKATYHDPCHLGRHVGIYDEPRAIIDAIPGLELTEMGRNREFAYCCGAGGGVKSAFPEWALKTGKERVTEAMETGAEVLITTCPFCERNLRDAVDDMGVDLEITDLVELVAKLAV